MDLRRIGRILLVAAVAVAFAVGSAQAMGKKEPVEQQKELGQGGTMTKSYDPETGQKKMEKTIGGGEKEMTLEKGPHEGATVERSWTTGSEKEHTEADTEAGGSTGKAKGKNK